MIRPAGLVVRVERRQRVLLVPGKTHLPREIAPCGIDAERRIEGDVPLLEILQELLPLLAVRRDEVPLPRDLAKAILLVVVVLSDGIGLDRRTVDRKST